MIRQARPREFLGESATMKTDMSATTLIEKLKALAPQRLAEVEDFVDFLRSREDERGLLRAASAASQPSFAQAWDNGDDAAYDEL